jgi:hypothetical protein
MTHIHLWYQPEGKYAEGFYGGHYADWPMLLCLVASSLLSHRWTVQRCSEASGDVRVMIYL